MPKTTLLGIVLIIVGSVALFLQGIAYTRQEEVLNLGPLSISAERQERIPLPPIVGGVALLAGIVLVAVGSKR